MSTIGTMAFVRAPMRQAQALLRAGGIGRVAFCRAASQEWLGVAREICPEVLIAEVDPAASGAVFLGSRATLVIGRTECRVLP